MRWTPIRTTAPALLALLYVGLYGCGGQAEAASGTDAPSLACLPGSLRACPCQVDGEMGMQRCLDDGDAYGICQGCPAVPATPPSPTSPPTPPAGTAGEAAPTPASPAPPPAPPAAAPPAAPTPATPGMDADAGTPTGDAPPTLPPPEPDDQLGTSCGVGLPTQCALGSELCCVRSLMTDTCVASREACDCPLSGCTIMTAECDGPEDCGDGEVCCGQLSGSSYASFTCQTSCDDRGDQRVACHVGEADACRPGTVCANSQLLTNLQVCIDPATIQQ